MNELQNVFNYHGAQVRTVIKDGEPLFVAKDVCEVLEISNHRDAVSRLRNSMKDEVGITDAIGRNQKTTVVNEAGVYKLTFTSRKPEAEKFTDWIAEEVLPSIRKHGAYMTPAKVEEVLLNPDTIIRLATDLKREREQRLLLQQQAEENKPKVIFAESLITSETSILIGELAKLLKQNGIKIGQNRLFQKLRDEGYLGKRGEYYNLPTQRSMELGLFEIKKTAIQQPNGTTLITNTTKVTGKGQCYFVNKYNPSVIEEVMA